MALRDYCNDRADFFLLEEPKGVCGLCFPCGECAHQAKESYQEPCCYCGHNADSNEVLADETSD